MSEGKAKEDILRYATNQYGNYLARNHQAGTDEIIKGIDLFEKIYTEKLNVPFSQKKGNYFEFIETAKFNQQAANAGATIRAQTTHAAGRPHDPADVEFLIGKKIVDKAQLKASDAASYDSDAYMAFINAQDKYKDMERVVPKDHFQRVHELTQKRADSNGIYKDAYKNSSENMTDQLTDRVTGKHIRSGGTTTKELEKINRNKTQYINDLKFTQFKAELINTTGKMALSSAVVSTIVSGVQNFYAVYKNRKSVQEGLSDLGIAVAKETMRGGATGTLATFIRVGAKEGQIPLLQSGTYAVTAAGGMIDCGCLLYAYAKGNINQDELCEGLIDTSIKTTSTIFLAKAVECAIGTTSIFIPMTIYTLASYVVANTREIIKNAHLNAEAYRKLAALHESAAREERNYRQLLEAQMDKYIKNKKNAMASFLNEFSTGINTGNYDGAVYAIMAFSQKFGLALKYVDFNEFDQMMLSDDVLKI